jgi:hypothetical protein
VAALCRPGAPYQPVEGARHLGRFGGGLFGVDQRHIPVAALEARQDVGVDQRFVDDAIELGQFRSEALADQLQQQGACRRVAGHLGAGSLDAGPQ